MQDDFNLMIMQCDRNMSLNFTVWEVCRVLHFTVRIQPSISMKLVVCLCCAIIHFNKIYCKMANRNNSKSFCNKRTFIHFILEYSSECFNFALMLISIVKCKCSLQVVFI